MTREQFIKDIGPAAKELGKQYNLLPSLIIGVACHESNFGASQLAKEGNNLFSVKGTYNGASVKLPTWEVYNGQRQDIIAEFRKYPSYKESMEDFCKLMKNGVSWNREIYHSVIGVTDWKEVIERFSKTPYMTDPDYFKKLYNITESYHLYRWNEETENEAPAAIEEEPATETETKEEPTPTPTPEAETDPEEQRPDGTFYVAYPRRTFKVGSKGNYVELIQDMLNSKGAKIKVDGVYGTVTAAYVTIFQNENDLVPDGIIGEATWHVLFNHK